MKQDEKKLLVLTNTNDKILPTSSTYTVEMGYDNNSGTTIIGKNATLGISPRGEAYTGEDVNHPVLKLKDVLLTINSYLTSSCFSSL